MLMSERMEKERLTVTKRIWCTPEKENGKKREPPSDCNIEVKIGQSGYMQIKHFNLHNENETWFSDQKSFREYVTGLQEVIAFIDSETNI